MLWLLSVLFVFVYVVVGVGIGNKILQVRLESGQNRLSKKISYVYLGGQVEQFFTSGISRASFEYLNSNICQKVFAGRDK